MKVTLAKNILFSGTLISMLLLGLARCKTPPSSSSLDSDDNTQNIADLRWLDRASRALRFGQALKSDDPLKKFLNRPKSEAVDALFKDPLFFPTLVDFYSFYYGFKSSEGIVKDSYESTFIFDPKERTLKGASNVECQKNPHCVNYPVEFNLSRNLSGHPATLSGAIAVHEGKDLGVIYNPTQPRYYSISTLNNMISSLIFLSQPDQAPNIPFNKLQPINIDNLQKKLLNSVSKAQATAEQYINLNKSSGSQSNPVVKDFCAKIAPLLTELNGLFALGRLVSIEILLTCFEGQNVTLKDIATFANNAKLLQANIKDTFLFLEQFLTKKLSPRYSTFIEIPENYASIPKSRLFDESFWEAHINSSTNYNRRRAAYVLKTFLCDDLTPVKLEIAQNAGDNRHASDPSCMACHYKLDPIAGFFRFYGAQGLNFDKSTDFIFDDQKRINGSELKKYLSSWDFPNKNGPNQGLNVGLIRSTTDASKNSYGSTLEDLGKLLANDPRTHVCKTQRLADYFIGSGQTYDRAWIDELARVMTTAPKASNGTAVKTVIKKLLLSKAFSTQDPVEGVCYDRARSSDSQSKLDCRVSSTIDKYCIKCHGRDSASGGLDLSQWSEAKGFNHQNEDGKSLGVKASYTKILKRLAPSEDGPIMPLNSPMPDPDRHVIKQWFEKQLQSIK